MTAPPHAGVAVVIACYTERRWELTQKAIASAASQTLAPVEIVVVVDHNEKLFNRLMALPWKSFEWSARTAVRVIRNVRGSGAGGARTTGAMTVTTEFLAFLDDDIEADPTWLYNLYSAVADDHYVGGAGAIIPAWSEGEPSWYPPELGWVIGVNDPSELSKGLKAVRNVWSSNMLLRLSDFLAVGGFHASFGKVGEISEPEDTELCLRMSKWSGKGWVLAPDAVVHHHVPAQRASYRYFARRCWLEGRGKALMREQLSGDPSATSSERDYLLRIVPLALLQYLVHDVRRSGAKRAATLASCTTIVCFAFLTQSALGAARRWRKR